MQRKINDSNKEAYNKIRKLILITISIMSIILLLFIGCYKYYKNMVVKSQENNILNLVTNISSQLELYFEEKDHYLKEILKQSQFQEEFIELIQGETNEVSLVALLYKLQNKEHISLELINKEGEILKVYTKDNQYEYKLGEDIKKAVKTQKDSYYVDTKERSINIIHPIKIKETVYGFIRMRIDASYIYDTYLEDYKLSEKGYITVKDKYARIILHPSNESIGEDVIKIRKKKYPNYDWSELENLVKRQKNKETGVGLYHSIWPEEDKRIKKISGFTPCKIGDTFLIISFSVGYKETIWNLKGITNVTIFISILLIITCIITILYIYRVEIKKNKLTLEMVYLNELKEKNALLMHQSKFAAMGEMLAMIAHQLKQPLNALKISLYNIDDYYSFKENDENYLKSLLSSNHKFIDKMAKTIDDFKFFFKPQRKDKDFNIYNAIAFAIDLNVARINQLEIEIKVQGNKDLKGNGESNIFSQVILNLLNNSIDALKNIKNKKCIYIAMREEENRIFIELIDNGGGIKKEVVNRIFEPYVTTKGENGTGLGLYISKIILKEKFNGDLWIENNKDGVKETIILPKGGQDECRKEST